MSTLARLSVLALGPLLNGACRAVGFKAADGAADAVVRFLAERFVDQGHRLPDALRRAAERGWRALEVALAGESLLSRFDRAEDRAFREQVRLFLVSSAGELPAGGPDFRRDCLRELRAARGAGLLEGGALNPEQLAADLSPLAARTEPQALLRAEWEAIDGLADELRRQGYPILADFLGLRPGGNPDAPPLLAAAVRYFFRREVESDPQLFHGLAFAQLERLAEGQEAGFGALADLLTASAGRLDERLAEVQETVAATHGHVLDIKEELARQGRHLQELGEAVLHVLSGHHLDRRALRAGDSLAFRTADEQRTMRALVGRYRALPEAERRQLPALLNAIGKLEVVAGEFEAAERDFRELADLVADPAAKAEAAHNRYRAALERRDWDAALAGLQEAVALDPARFAPFPPGKFEPLRVLGAGGFGVAVLCRNRHSRSKVVVKALHPDGPGRDLADVFREAQALESVEHPAVIRLRDCDFADPEQTRPFLVMDYFDAPTLADHVAANGPLPVEDFIPLARLAAEGLRAAHARGVLHRDVKPANLLVRRSAGTSWEVKLIDFGLALRQGALGATLATRTASATRSALHDSIAGTLDYAAPEQIGRLPGVPVDRRSDVYAFARTCCFALFGTPQPLRKHWRSVPEDLADLLETCLAEDPAERPADFGEVLERLAPQATAQDEPEERVPDPSRFWAAEPAAPTITLAPGEVARLEGHAGPVTCVAVSPDGKRILTGSEDRTVRVWDVERRLELRCLPGHKDQVCCVALSPDGSRALSSGTDQTVRLWDVESGVEIRCFDRQTNRSVAFAPDGKRALCGSLYDGKLRLWDLTTGKELRRFVGHADWVVCVAFTQDGRHAISGSLDRTVRLWEVETGREVRRFPIQEGVVSSIAFSPDGWHILSGGADRLVRVWDTFTGTELFRLVGHTDIVSGVAVGASGTRALSASHDGTVRYWDLERKREIQKLTGHRGPALCVGFLPEGDRAVSGGSDGTVRLWGRTAT